MLTNESLLVHLNVSFAKCPINELMSSSTMTFLSIIRRASSDWYTWKNHLWNGFWATFKNNTVTSERANPAQQNGIRRNSQIYSGCCWNAASNPQDDQLLLVPLRLLPNASIVIIKIIIVIIMTTTRRRWIILLTTRARLGRTYDSDENSWQDDNRPTDDCKVKTDEEITPRHQCGEQKTRYAKWIKTKKKKKNKPTCLSWGHTADVRV